MHTLFIYKLLIHNSVLYTARHFLEVAVSVNHFVCIHRYFLAFDGQDVEGGVAIAVSPGIVDLMDFVSAIVLYGSLMGVSHEEGGEVILLEDVEELRALLLRPPFERPLVEAVVLYVNHGSTVCGILLQVVGYPLHVALAIGGVAGSELSAHEVHTAYVERVRAR